MKLGRKDFAADLEDALEYVPADVSADHPDRDPARARPLPAQGHHRALLRRGGAGARPPGRRRGQRGGRAADAGHVQRRPWPAGRLGQRSARADRAGPRHGRAPGRRGRAAGAAVNESHLLEGAGEHEHAAAAARRATESADAQLLSRTSGSVLAINQAEPLFALGRWDEALTIADRGHGPLPRARADEPGAAARHHRLHPAGPGRPGRGGAEPDDGARRAAFGPLRGSAPASAGPAGDPVTRWRRTARLPRSRPRRRPWTVSSCAAAARGMPGRWWSRAPPRSWPPPGWPGPRTTSGCVTRPPGLRTGCARWRRSWRRSARRSGLFRLTFAAADADAARLIAAFPDGSGLLAAGLLASPVLVPVSGSRFRSLAAARAPGCCAAWDQAAAAWAGLGEPYPLGETLLHAAEAALACGDRDGAAERLQRAAPLAARSARSRSASRSPSWRGAPGSGWPR